MFSATIPPRIEKMASEMMKNPLFISVGVVSRLQFHYWTHTESVRYFMHLHFQRRWLALHG